MKFRKPLALLMAAAVSFCAAYPATAVTITEEPAVSAAEESTGSNWISYVRMNNESAVAKISAKQDAKLIIEVCSDDDEGKVLLTATGNVKANGTSSKVKFEAAIPETFGLRARMVSADGKTVYTEYYTPYYTKEVQDLLKTETVDEETRRQWVEDSAKALVFYNSAGLSQSDGLSVCLDHSKTCPEHIIIPDKATASVYKDDESKQTVLPVTAIYNSGFESDKLLSIEISDNIQYIDMHAFRNASKLKQMILPDSVTFIGTAAFEGANSITSMVVPSSVTDIRSQAFSCMNNLETIIFLPTESETVIMTNQEDKYHSNICQQDTKLKTAKIYASWDIIPDRLFYLDSALETVILPHTASSIGDSAFGHCESLKQLDIPASVKKIGEHAFINCNSLTGLNLPEGLEEIGSRAFESCKSMSSIELPASVTTLGENVFPMNREDSVSLNDITILNPNLGADQLENAFSSYIGSYADSYIKPTLKGYKGSTTESFAKTYGFPFAALDGSEPQTTTAPAVTTAPGTTAETVHTVKDPNSKVCGDITMDGVVDVADAVLTARFVVSDITAIITDQGKKNGDVNQDGSLDDTDLQLILLFIAKRIEVLPYKPAEKTA